MSWLDGSFGFGRRASSVWAAERQYCARFAGRVPPVLVIGVIGFVLSIGAGFGVAHNVEDKYTQDTLDASGENRRLVLQNALADVEYTILSVARQLAFSDKTVDRREFDRVTDPQNGIFAISSEIDWAPRVREGDRIPHELAASDGRPGYRINTLGPDGKSVPATGRDEYFPILFARGSRHGSTDFGFDIGSDAAQRDAMERILNGAALAATAPAKRADLGFQEAVVFLFAPKFEPGALHDTAQDRRHNLMGFVRVALVPSALINQVLRGQHSALGADISFFQAGAGPVALPFYVRSSPSRTTPASASPRGELDAGLHFTGEVTLADSRWTMIVTPVPGGSILADHGRAALVAAMGLLLTVALMTYVQITHRNTSRLRRLLLDLHESEARFRRVTDNALNAIIKADAEGNVNFWNPAAERIFGYKQEEILGRSVYEVLATERDGTKTTLDSVLCAQTEEGAALGKTIELHGRRKDGSEFPAELSISSVLRHGARSSIALVRDITDRTRIADMLKYRSELLRAVSIIASELVAAATVEDAISEVLKTIGEAARVDRVLVVETKLEESGDVVPVLRYSWNSPDAPDMLDRASFAETAPAEFEMDPWLAPLAKEKPSQVWRGP